MSKLKIFCIAFIFTFTLIAILCVLTSKPLIFLPVNYFPLAFVKFALLIGAFSFGLAFIVLPILHFSYQRLKIAIRETIFCLIGTFFILQILFLTAGFFESRFLMLRGDFLYYYRGVGNSLIYIAIWNLTSLACSYFYANKEIEEKSPEFLDWGNKFR